MIETAIHRELRDLHQQGEELAKLSASGDSYVVAELLLTLREMNERLGGFIDELDLPTSDDPPNPAA